MFAVMVFPVLRFVFDKVKLPVMRRVMDPSAALRTLKYSLSTGKNTPIWNPQKSAGRMTSPGGGALNCHLGPGPGPGRPSPLLRTCPAARPAPRSLPVASSRSPPRAGTGQRGQVRRSAGHRLLVPAQHGPVASGLNPAGILLAANGGTAAAPVVEWCLAVARASGR